MRIAALTILGITCALVGQYIAYSFNMRVRLLEKCELMLCIISNEINFLSRPADELVSELAKKNELSQLKFLTSSDDAIKSGSDFRTAWHSSLNKKENIHYFDKSDVSLLESFGNQFGTTDSAGQLSNCSLYLELLKENMNNAKEQSARYSALSSGLGFLTGIGVIIVFI